MRNHTLSVASLTVLIFVSLSHAQQKQPVERTDQLLRSADEARSFAIAEALLGAPSAAQQSEPTRVHASESIPRHISVGETHEYLLVLNARQALHVVVNQLGVDVVVDVSGPDGELIVEMDSPNGSQGPESVWVIASKTGDYIFRVHPLQRTASGRYEFRVETIHDATAEDQTRVRMQRATLNGQRLLGEGGAKNRAAAAGHLREAFAAALQIKDTATAGAVGFNFVRLDPKAALDILGLSSAPGATPLYYSRGHEQRGRELRERLTGAIRFFESRLNVAPKVMLTVLSQEDWTVLTSIPQYPLPWSVVPSWSAASDRAALVAMPATRGQGGGEFAALMQPGALPGDVVKSLEATGLPMEDGLRLASDGIMYHELGHVYADAVGLPPRTNWLGEFFADFLWVAYFTDGSVDPRAVAYTNALMTWLLSMKPTNTSLEDFDRLYTRVSNYGWYQAQFGKRAADVYKAQGLAFLKRARDVLPPTNQPIAVDEALKRLEQVSPGFVEWAASLSARK